MTDIQENIALIAESIAMDQSTAGFKADFIIPYLKIAINKFVILLDSRYGNKAEIIRLVSSAMDDSEHAPPFMISVAQWEQLYEEARSWAYKTKKGKIVQPLEILESVIEFYNKGYDEGKIFPDWPKLSDHYRIAKKELNIITGIPGHGKSEFMDAMMVEMAQSYKWRFAIFSPENFPYAIHCEKLLSKLIGKPFHKGMTERMSPQELAEKMNWIHDHFVFIEPEENAIHLEAVLGLVQKTIEDFKVDGVVLDPWNEIEHNRPEGKSETDYIGESLMKCRRFARRQNIAFWMVAHPSKQHKNKETGIFDPPTPYDISGSAHWRNKADNCLCVYRNQDDSVTIHIQKIKFKIRGRLGQVDFMYDKITGRYTEKEEDRNKLPE